MKTNTKKLMEKTIEEEKKNFFLNYFKLFFIIFLT